ncbi:MFS transporter [Thalassiella azotivora]
MPADDDPTPSRAAPAPTGPRAGGWAELLVVLRTRDFRRLLSTRLVSQLGDGAFQASLASLFFFSPERAATAAGAAAAFAVALLPYSVLGPFVGVLLDRWRRRQVLVRANLVRAAMVLVVAALVANGVVGVLLYVAVLLCLSVNRFFLAGLGASLPHVVPSERLVMANAVTPTSGTVAALVGAALAFAVRGALGAGDGTDALVLLLAAGAYLGSALLATRMHPDLLGPDPDSRAHAPATAEHLRVVVVELVLGARHVRHRPPAFHGLAVIGAHRILYGLSTIATILLCRHHFTDGDDVDAGLALLATVVTTSGAGFALAAVVTPRATRSLGPRGWVVTCLVVATLAQGAFAAVPEVPVLVGGAFLLGLGAQGAKICVDALVQRHVDDAFRGRVFAFYDVVFNAAFVAAAVLAIAVVPPDGLSVGLFAAIAVGYLLTAGAYVVTERRAPVRAAGPAEDPPT